MVELESFAAKLRADGWTVDLCRFNGSKLVTAARGVRLISILAQAGDWLVIHGAGRFVVAAGDAEGVAREMQRC
jgi:hypothetical protein